MGDIKRFFSSWSVIAAAMFALQGCSGDAPAPHVWQARHVLVHAGGGGHVVEALWVRNGLSLIARHRTTHLVDDGHLLLDIERQLLWLRDGPVLQALSLPELEPIAGLPLPGDAGAITLAADGAVVIAGVRYRLATEDDGGEAIAGAQTPVVVRESRRG